jgi:pimeloyl-ACP methyl ester carboxylesterase
MLGRMNWTAPQINRQSTPLVAGERQMLEAWLEFHRQTLLAKCSGLTAGQLRQRAAPPSPLSLLGLVRHMTDVERGWSRAARAAVAARGARRAGCRGAPRHAMKAQFDATTRFDATARLGQIAAPVLIVHGTSDHVAPVALARQMHALIPGSRLVLIDGGHLAPLLTQHERLVSEVSAFLTA